MPISDHLLAMVSHQMNADDYLKIDLRKFLSWSSLVNAVRDQLIDVAFVKETKSTVFLCRTLEYQSRL